MNKQQMLEVWKDDGELQPGYEKDGKAIPKKICLKNIINGQCYCPSCGSKRTYRLDTDDQPEWTYICPRCRVKFIAVWEEIQ